MSTPSTRSKQKAFQKLMDAMTYVYRCLEPLSDNAWDGMIGIVNAIGEKSGDPEIRKKVMEWIRWVNARETKHFNDSLKGK